MRIGHPARRFRVKRKGHKNHKHRQDMLKFQSLCNKHNFHTRPSPSVGSTSTYSPPLTMVGSHLVQLSLNMSAIFPQREGEITPTSRALIALWACSRSLFKRSLSAISYVRVSTVAIVRKSLLHVAPIV